MGGHLGHFRSPLQDALLVRLNSDGSLDTSFDAGTGARSSDGGRRTFVKRIVLQPDGQILVSGNFTSFDGFPRAHLVRLNGDAKALRLGPLVLTSDGAASLTVFPGGRALGSIEIQTATQLSPPDWQPVTGNWEAVGSSDVYRFAVSAESRRFYRAVGR